jgi:hypothetical protein
MDDPAWKDDIGKLANGFIGRQQNGAWHTTTANLWGGLALDQILEGVREHAGGRHHHRRAASSGVGNADSAAAPQRRLEPRRAREGQRRRRAPQPGHLVRRARFAGQPAQQHHVPALGAAPVRETLTVTQSGTGKPWLTLQSWPRCS